MAEEKATLGAGCFWGVEATFRLVADPALDGVSGVFFNGLREATPDAQAADADARRRLWALSEELTAG